MENRWSFKDILVCVLLLICIASVWLGMTQFDRQWTDVKTLKTQIDELTGVQTRTTRELNEIRELMERGINVAPPNPPVATKDGKTTPPPVRTDLYDPFERLKQARAKEGFAQGDWIIDAFGAKVAKITPHTYKDLYGRRIQEHVLEGLISLNPMTLEYEPHIAKSWQMSKDGLTVTFQLRKNVVFSDGHPLTAEDVVFSLELQQNPKLDAAAERQFYDNIESCTATNEYEVVFKMKEPHYMALSMAGGRNVLPKHFYEKFTIDEINKHPGLLMGTGPYRLPDPKGWAPGKLIELVRNERYWGPQPGFDKVIFKEIENDVARLTSYRNGEIDVFSALPPQYEDLRKDANVMARSRALNYDTVPTGYMFIAWQQKRDDKPTKFADKRVRQAMTYLTDRDRICKEVMLGYATPASGPFAPGSKQENKQIKAYPYDMEKGKALLKEAGWEDRNNDGILENEKGEQFKFKFTYPSGSALYDRVVLYLKDSYAKAGVILEPDTLEWSVFSDRLEQQQFEAVTLRWGGGAVEADIRQMFHSSQANKGGDNFMCYVNPKIDQIIDDARRTIDDDARFKLWHEAHAILAEDQPYTFMFTQQALRFIDKRVENVQLTTEGISERWEWFAPASKQKWK
jgi:peptide/nickel transport system substrate-binding protein